MPKAMLKELDPVKGFGTLVLETGEELMFDISASNKREPKAGDRAEVTIGVGWKGQPKAKRVIFELEEDLAPSFAKGVEQLRALGFLRQWHVEQASAALKELDGKVPAKLTRGGAGDVLQHYYGEGITERGRAEGVITLDWRYGQVTSQPIADICAICPQPLSIQFELGESLLPLLAELDRELTARGSPHRYFSLDFGSDFYVIACRPCDFATQVAVTGWLKLG